MNSIIYNKLRLHVFVELSASLHLCPNLFLLPFIVFFIYSASLEVDVNCWWNRAHPVGHNVSVVCHTSARGRAKSCDLFQLCVITPGQRHLLPSTCVSAKETFNFSIAIKHTGHIRCMCNGKTSDTCNLTVRGGCEYNRIDHLSTMNSLLNLGMLWVSQVLCTSVYVHMTHTHTFYTHNHKM